MTSKSEYLETLGARLALWNAELAELASRARARADLEQALAELRRLRDDAAAQTRAIERAGESEWETLAGTAEKEFEALGAAFQRARSRFGE
ncbi:MAG: hypothetical protein M5U08_23005 [Burkholderiales bacterium]|nr:hypothetical protein [Burkholderiales bacterium]